MTKYLCRSIGYLIVSLPIFAIVMLYVDIYMKSYLMEILFVLGFQFLCLLIIFLVVGFGFWILGKCK